MPDFLFWRRSKRFTAETAYQINAQVPPLDDNPESSKSLLPSTAPGLLRVAALIAATVPLLLSSPVHFTSENLAAPGVQVYPDRAPGQQRAAQTAYNAQIPPVVDIVSGQDPVTPGSALFPSRAPSLLGPQRASNTAYHIKLSSQERFVADSDPLPPGRQLLPSLSRSYTSLQGINTTSLSPDLLPASPVYPSRVAPKVTAQTAYNLALSQPVGAAEALPEGKSLIPDKALGPSRVANSAYSALLSTFVNLDALQDGKLLLPDHAPSPRRAANSTYRVLLSNYQIDDAAAPQALPEGRQLWPSLGHSIQVSHGISGSSLAPPSDLPTPGVFTPPSVIPRRAGNEAYRILHGLIPPPDAIFPPAPTSLTNLSSPLKSHFQPATSYQTYSTLGSSITDPVGTGFIPTEAKGAKRASSTAYQLLLSSYPVDSIGDINLPDGKPLLPDRAPSALRAPYSAYIALQSSFITPESEPREFIQSLLPSIAPGRPRAAATAYIIKFPTFPVEDDVLPPPSLGATRLVLGHDPGSEVSINMTPTLGHS